MSDTSLSPQSVAFKDRRTGLLVFGILEILLGCLSVLLLVIFLGTFVLASYSESAAGLGVYGFAGSMDWHLACITAVFYTALAAVFISLGIGSIYCLRWAYALNHILAWSWLLGGILSTGLFFVAMRSMQIPWTGTGFDTLLIAFMGILQGIFFVVLPAIGVVFFSSRNVKATCEARDRVRRWTDACPMPVLGSALWIGIGALGVLAMPLFYHSVVPFFGILITGFPAVLTLALVAGFWLYIAWETYRLKILALWLGVASFALLTASVVITFLRVNPMDMYRRLGYQENQIRVLQSTGLFEGRAVVWWAAAFFLVFLLYSFWIRKYFRQDSSR